MTHRFKVEIKDCQDLWRARGVLTPFTRRGVKVTYRRNALYVHLEEDKAYSYILLYLKGCANKGTLSSTAKGMSWLRKIF